MQVEPPDASCRSSFNTVEYESAAICPSDSYSSHPALHALIRPHIESYNSLFDDSQLLDLAVQALEVRELTDFAGNKMNIWLEDVEVGRAMLPEKEKRSLRRALLPRECRERGISYKAKLTAHLAYSVNGGPTKKELRILGQLPIMVKSERCHLEGLSPKELIERKEDDEELGGYFIINGIERLVRLLIVARRNHVLALVRPSFAKRGPNYTSFGCQIRCVRNDQTSQTNYLQYLNDGQCIFRFSYRKSEYLVPLPLILRALLATDDKTIFEGIVQGDLSNTFVTSRVEIMLREFAKYGIYSRTQCLTHLGSRFHVIFGMPKESTYEEVGKEFLRRVVLVHLEKTQDKFNLLIFMVRKVYALAQGSCCADNADSPMHQEILLTGHLFLGILKEKLDDWLASLQNLVLGDVRKSPAQVNFVDGGVYFRRLLGRLPSDVGRKLEYFLATGNLVSNSGLDLQQTSGYTVVAEKLNFLRFLSHFRSVHRGAFFAELKTTTVRKLLPEAWGFLCPVHTPDGAPCGLLNHLAHKCQIVISQPDTEPILPLLHALGVIPLSTTSRNTPEWLSVLLDGKWIGFVTVEQLMPLADKLRQLKCTEKRSLLKDLEIGAITISKGGIYPGLYLYTSPARMMRPVKNIITNEIELIGTLEQVYMNIAVRNEEVIPSLTTHVEEDPTNILSVIANQTPFSDFNQSPRNMYQCQMGKQTMGTPVHAFPHRADNKLYRLHTGQTPIVRAKLHDDFAFDSYPNGANAIVAVISYTGYDMEDGMILNKSTVERGFGHATVYKSEFFDISDRNVRGEAKSHHFGVLDRKTTGKTLDLDGLPMVGQRVKPDDPLFSVTDESTGTVRIERYKAFEEAVIEEVRLLGDDVGESELQKVNIKFRINRNPVIGDKFSSRHGQKGVCSQQLPQVDMPFTESGMTPDLIINPHAFPSRMTIGMLLESMAAKAGSLHGISQDATPFQFSEEHTAADYFGEQLLKAGYNYYGNEVMYSGVNGVEMKADIYIGVVYYQRLRHMVSDKFQVRTTGPVHNLTQQPVKGRKRAGGIRFGEMERDSMLAHGVAFMLQDRLMNCSDYSQTYICRGCGSILSPIARPAASLLPNAHDVKCISCNKLADSQEKIDVIAIPFVFRYLAAELMAMNIGLRLEIS